jgi:uncharacterized membrane protein YbaN (DUF454 family)
MPKINKKSSLRCFILKKDLFKTGIINSKLYVLTTAMYEGIKKHLFFLLQLILFKSDENYRSCHILSKHTALLQKSQVFSTGKVIAEKIKEHIHIQVVFNVYYVAEIC